MMPSRPAVQKAASRAADAAVAVVGNAAGTVVAPRTAVTKLRSSLMSPAVAGLGVLVALAYVLGRRRRPR